MKKGRRECNSMLLRVKEEITNPTIVEEKKNEYANEVKLTMGRRKGEKQHHQIKFQNVLVRIDKFNFSIDLVTLGREEDNQASTKDRPSSPFVKHGLI